MRSSRRNRSQMRITVTSRVAAKRVVRASND
jgi:hypothetical protein